MNIERLDVRGMAAPEQMELVLLALSTLSPDKKLCASMDLEPYPLYRMLDQNGFAHTTHAYSAELFDIVIWFATPP
ncbi:MAG: DUF2249 domain-containing protein [Telluria sp.]